MWQRPLALPTIKIIDATNHKWQGYCTLNFPLEGQPYIDKGESQTDLITD